MALEILSIFSSCSSQLKFTHELLHNGSIQFLDLKLDFPSADHACWAFKPRSKEALLPFNSFHSKLIKRGIASSCFRSALLKSCHHKQLSSFQLQVGPLEKVGFPSSLLLSVAKPPLVKLRKKDKEPSISSEQASWKNFAVLPYIHKVSHNLKKNSGKYGVDVVLSAPCKLFKLCSMVARGSTGSPPCKIKHTNPLVPCMTCVIYKIPLKCGRYWTNR